MQKGLELTWFNVATDELAGQSFLPDGDERQLRQLLELPPDDDALGAFPIQDKQGGQVEALFSLRLDFNRFHYFLELVQQTDDTK